jgi:hypothetical protein
MQTQAEMGKWVTDGKMVYPYNAFLDELLNNGTLKFCEKPDPKPRAAPILATLRSPVRMSPDERAETAAKLGITIGELGNMSPQELAEAEANVKIPETDGFPK